MNATKSGQNDTGDCHETFGTDWATNLTLAMEKAWTNVTSFNSSGNACSGFLMPTLQPQCAGLLALTSAAGIIEPLSTYTIGITTNFSLIQTKC